ncbi:hypothetical protein BpHYR1_009334 [Brachionus plicatilis]|uniref:Secreted protein n=1 Tax=Brachionus plicatilis TaxID=10195 RepID=A0A3M7QL10_BRAPC|nr:hypothetical protein BpHYR1_009334 [Brachionus plicatilis]
MHKYKKLAVIFLGLPRLCLSETNNKCSLTLVAARKVLELLQLVKRQLPYFSKKKKTLPFSFIKGKTSRFYIFKASFS